LDLKSSVLHIGMFVCVFILFYYLKPKFYIKTIFEYMLQYFLFSNVT